MAFWILYTANRLAPDPGNIFLSKPISISFFFFLNFICSLHWKIKLFNIWLVEKIVKLCTASYQEYLLQNLVTCFLPVGRGVVSVYVRIFSIQPTTLNSNCKHDWSSAVQHLTWFHNGATVLKATKCKWWQHKLCMYSWRMYVQYKRGKA